MPFSVHTEVLRRAAQILGGAVELRARLRVPMRELEAWLAGAQAPPRHVFLIAVDIVTVERIASAARAAGERTREAHARSEAAMRRSRGILASVVAHRPPFAAARRNVAPGDFAAAQFAPGEARQMIEAALNAAIGPGPAARANLQLGTGDGLRIVGHLGFEEPFLRFFETVRHDTPSTCGPAYRRGARIVVPDVAADPVFAGTPAAEVMDRAGVRACQSTPLLSGAGRVIGMLSTHYESPHDPPPDELQAIDLVAQRAALWLDAREGRREIA